MTKDPEAQPYCDRHGFTFHSCCRECIHEHGKEDYRGPCKACEEERLEKKDVK